jgi:hypothetical protein
MVHGKSYEVQMIEWSNEDNSSTDGSVSDIEENYCYSRDFNKDNGSTLEEKVVSSAPSLRGLFIGTFVLSSLGYIGYRMYDYFF